MIKKIKNAWEELNVEVVVNKRELVLVVALCAAIAMLVGVFFSPNKQVTIGSNNCDNGNYKNHDNDDEDDE